YQRKSIGAVELGLHIVHLRAHARARPGTVGKEEIRHPDLAAQRLRTGEIVALLIGQRKVRNRPVNGQISMRSAACEQQGASSESRQAKQTHREGGERRRGQAAHDAREEESNGGRGGRRQKKKTARAPAPQTNTACPPYRRT